MHLSRLWTDTQVQTTIANHKNHSMRRMKHECTCHVYGQIHKFGIKNLINRARKGHARRRGAGRKVLTGAKGAPANRSQEGPKEKKASNSTKRSNEKERPEKPGGEKEEENLCLTPCSVFKVVLLVCSESVIPAVPDRKGDRVRPFCPCGQEP